MTLDSSRSLTGMEALSSLISHVLIPAQSGSRTPKEGVTSQSVRDHLHDILRGNIEYLLEKCVKSVRMGICPASGVAIGKCEDRRCVRISCGNVPIMQIAREDVGKLRQELLASRFRASLTQREAPHAGEVGEAILAAFSLVVDMDTMLAEA
jgi:hypothetical protein